MNRQKINTALASFGMSGKVFHAPVLSRHPGFELTKIVERSKNELAGIYPHIQSVRSFEDLLADDSIELIIVNTPDFTHYEYTSKALKAGKHVIVEKPFTQSVEDGNALIDSAKKQNRILSVFQNRRWDGDFLTVRKIIENGNLGRLVEFEANYMRFRNYIQADTWKESPELGSSITYNLGSHMIDQALTLFGMPQSVWADIDTLRDGGLIDDYYHIRLIYPSIKVSLKATYLAREETPRYILHGTEGSFLKYGIDPQEELLKKGGNPFEPDWGKEPESLWGILNTRINGLHFRGKIETEAGNYAAYYDNIYDAIRNDAPLSVTPQQSLDAIRVIVAAFKSSAEKNSVALE
jgi:predicted dehydrogenase